VKLRLDLHDIHNRGERSSALRAIIEEAVAKKAPLVEIIPEGLGTTQEAGPTIPRPHGDQGGHHRVEKDSAGRVFVHFRWK
jgi:hypothetical protein